MYVGDAAVSWVGSQSTHAASQTFLEVIRVRWGKVAHFTFMVFVSFTSFNRKELQLTRVVSTGTRRQHPRFGDAGNRRQLDSLRADRDADSYVHM